MTSPSRDDVSHLLDQVISLRQQQPKAFQDVYKDISLKTLMDVKFEEGRKLTEFPHNVDNLPEIKINLDMSKLEEMETTLIEQLQILRVLCAKKNCAVGKIVKEGS